jgi:hypothetical protein
LLSQAWWCRFVIPGFGKLRLMNCKFKTSFEYIVRLCLTKQNKIMVAEEFREHHKEGHSFENVLEDI